MSRLWSSPLTALVVSRNWFKPHKSRPFKVCFPFFTSFPQLQTLLGGYLILQSVQKLDLGAFEQTINAHVCHVCMSLVHTNIVISNSFWNKSLQHNTNGFHPIPKPNAWPYISESLPNVESYSLRHLSLLS